MYPLRTTKKRKRRPGPVSPTKGPPAGDQELFLTLLNAVVPGGEVDFSTGSLGHWLIQRGLLAEDEEVSSDALVRLRKTCHGLRALIAASTGARVETKAVAELVRLTPPALLQPRLGTDGSTWLAPSSDGVDGVVERLFAIATVARLENCWPRFKICIDGSCGRVFYDESRNLRARWCSARCKNRSASTSYRRRASLKGSSSAKSVDG